MKTAIFRNLYYVLAAGWRQRYTIAICTLLIPVIATAIGALTKRQYSSYTTVLIQEASKMNPFLKDYSVDTQLKDRMAGMQALLHSRHVLVEVARELTLIPPEQANTDDIVKKLSAALTVELIGADLIRISYKGDSPERISDILNAVTRHFLDKLLAPERSSIDSSEGFLEKQLEIQRVSLMTAEKKLADFKVQYSARLPDQYSYDVMKLRDAEEKLNERKIELAGIEAKLDSLRGELLKNDPRVASIEDEIVKRSAELALLRSRYTEKHSRVVAAQRTVDRLQSEREKMLTDARNTTPQELEKMWQLASNVSVSTDDTTQKPLLVSQLEAIEKARSKEKQIREESAELEKIIADMSKKLSNFAEVEQEMAELTRDSTTRQHVYDDLLKRYEMAKVTGALGRFEETDRAKVIDMPYVPTSPDNLPVFIFSIAGILAGFFLGRATALIKELTDTSLVRTETIVTLLGVPVIARLPQLPLSVPMAKIDAQNTLTQQGTIS